MRAAARSGRSSRPRTSALTTCRRSHGAWNGCHICALSRTILSAASNTTSARASPSVMNSSSPMGRRSTSECPSRIARTTWTSCQQPDTAAASWPRVIRKTVSCGTVPEPSGKSTDGSGSPGIWRRSQYCQPPCVTLGGRTDGPPPKPPRPGSSRCSNGGAHPTRHRKPSIPDSGPTMTSSTSAATRALRSRASCATRRRSCSALYSASSAAPSEVRRPSASADHCGGEALDLALRGCAGGRAHQLDRVLRRQAVAANEAFEHATHDGRHAVAATPPEDPFWERCQRLDPRARRRVPTLVAGRGATRLVGPVSLKTGRQSGHDGCGEKAVRLGRRGLDAEEGTALALHVNRAGEVQGHERIEGVGGRAEPIDLGPLVCVEDINPADAAHL